MYTTEEQLEQLCREWFQSVGYDFLNTYFLIPNALKAHGGAGHA